MELFPCRIRRRLSKGLKRKPMALIKRLRQAKKEAGPLEKPEVNHESETVNIDIFLYIKQGCIWMLWLNLPRNKEEKRSGNKNFFLFGDSGL